MYTSFGEAEKYRRYFDPKFQRIFDEIKEIRKKLYLTDGFLFFKFYKYTLQELVQLPHFSKIHAVRQKINDDVGSWENNAAISEIGRQEYLKRCKQVETALNQLNQEIRQRQPTVWQRAHRLFQRFVNLVGHVPVASQILKIFPARNDNKQPLILPPATANAGTSLIEDMKNRNQHRCDKLQAYLARGMWKEADIETGWLLCQLFGRGKEGYLELEHISSLPCQTLLMIDKLWRDYSSNRFGFSVQSAIFNSLAKYDRAWERFCETVGWSNQAFVRRGRRALLYYDELDFHKSAPKGHLPRSLEIRGKEVGFAGERKWRALFHRLWKCYTRKKH